MEKKTFEGAGILKANGEVFLVIAGHSDMPNDAYQFTFNHEVPCFYVAKRFGVEKTIEGILTAEDLYITPRWISLGCPFTVEWFPEPKPFEVLMLWNTDEVMNG